MSGLILHLSADEIGRRERAPLVVPQSGGRYSVLAAQRDDEHVGLTVWLTGSVEQLAAACRRLADEIDTLADSLKAAT